MANVVRCLAGVRNSLSSVNYVVVFAWPNKGAVNFYIGDNKYGGFVYAAALIVPGKSTDAIKVGSTSTNASVDFDCGDMGQY